MLSQSVVLLSALHLISAVSYPNVFFDTDADCVDSDGKTRVDTNFAQLLKFSTRVAYGEKNCSMDFHHPWSNQTQNGFGIFLSRSIDCGSLVTVQCLNNQISSPTVQFTCHQSVHHAVLPCSAITVTYKRNIQMNVDKVSTHIQLIALTQGPCIDADLFFSCPNDYHQSCLAANLRCNGRSECPSGDDERSCHATSAGPSILIIVLIILAFLFLLCILSTVLICCFCRAAIQSLIRRFRSNRRNPSAERGDVTINGEDAGLIKGLTGNTAMADVTATPAPSNREPAPLMIDSTKPIYPRLE